MLNLSSLHSEFNKKMIDTPPFHGLKLPLYEQVRWHIQQRLSTHQMRFDEPIPTEKTLAENYGVSIGTVRKAIEKLTQEGILVKVQGKGTFLKKPDFHASLLRFFRMRNHKGDFVLPVGRVQKVQLIESIDYINDILGEKNNKLLYIERIRMVDDEIVLSEQIWLPEKAFQAIAHLPAEQFGNLLYPFYAEQCHQYVFSASEQLSFTQQHRDPYLSNKTQEWLVKISRTACNLNGQAIEYRESYGYPHNFNYAIKIT